MLHYRFIVKTHIQPTNSKKELKNRPITNLMITNTAATLSIRTTSLFLHFFHASCYCYKKLSPRCRLSYSSVNIQHGNGSISLGTSSTLTIVKSITPFLGHALLGTMGRRNRMHQSVPVTSEVKRRDCLANPAGRSLLRN